jgi:tetratricopeptide (TPR) repeat protein
VDVAIGKAQAQQGHVNEAAATFIQALDRLEAPEDRKALIDRSRELDDVPAVMLLAKVSADDPKDMELSLKVAALQAWFGQEKELAATRQRVLAFAKDTHEAITAGRAARVCSILPSADKAELEAALVLARSAVKLGNDGDYRNLQALGMAEYRNGNSAAAEKALRAAADAVKNIPGDAPPVTGMSSFFRAMSLFRLGKKDEARQLAIAAAAKMKPLPADEQNPLAANVGHDDLILWLAYKEAKALIKFDVAPAAPATASGK